MATNTYLCTSLEACSLMLKASASGHITHEYLKLGALVRTRLGTKGPICVHCPFCGADIRDIVTENWGRA